MTIDVDLPNLIPHSSPTLIKSNHARDFRPEWEIENYNVYSSVAPYTVTVTTGPWDIKS